MERDFFPDVAVIAELGYACVLVLGCLALFGGACMAGAWICFYTAWVVRWVRERWRFVVERQEIWSPAHYSADHDFAVLPRSYFEELLPPHLKRAWMAILNRFRHQPWPPSGCDVSVSVRRRDGKFRPLRADDLKPRQ